MSICPEHIHPFPEVQHLQKIMFEQNAIGNEFASKGFLGICLCMLYG